MFQLFRKDLISAMKLPDNEPLEADDYWTVADTWKQEWERGVQVPVKPDGLPEPHVSALLPSHKSERFTLTKKLICMNTSGSYKPETHQVTPMVLRAEQVCTYDLDLVDRSWLESLNGERALVGLSSVTESEVEHSMEELEKQCREKINTTLRNSDDLDIAQDDSIICDVCRSVSGGALWAGRVAVVRRSLRCGQLMRAVQWLPGRPAARSESLIRHSDVTLPA